MIEALRYIFVEVLEHKSFYIDTIKKRFKRLYENNNQNLLSEKELIEDLKKEESFLEKELDLYRMGYVSKEKLDEKAAPIRTKILKLKEQLKMVQYDITKEDKVEEILESTFKDIEDLVDVENMDNVMLKRVIEKIEVDSNKEVKVCFKVLGNVGTVGTVQLNDFSPQGCNGKTS